ncbi:hypothetical protein [Sphingobium phenoxybenzoativorans]|uniref:hypothetical protein n=1 Tax=Sphingobium phenoxybenzoativorans TaxID=1592790 RepID=UPI000872CBD8|nr:hypothetical protein [Sphingobium phenoxybenzoativorans]
MRRSSFALLLLLAACRDPSPLQEGRGSVPSAGRQSGEQSALEQAALEAGVIADAGKTAVTGLYQRRHEAGRDSLCITPGDGRRYRFGLEAIFGTEQYCRGEGTARQVGDKLILRFTGGSQCLIVAQYDGDRIAMPGVVDMKCVEVCSGRGSLEGVAFPRLLSDASAARSLPDSNGEPLCEGR